MSSSELQQWLSQQIRVGDGATGTQLQEKGLVRGACPEEWNITHPEEVASIPRAYVSAGAEVVTTNTFGGNRARLAHYGFQDRVYEFNTAGVRLAREVVEGKALVAASVGPTGRFLEPLGDMSEEECRDIFREQIQALAEAKPDFILLETFYALEEAQIAIEEALQTGLAVVCSMSYDLGGRTMMGLLPEPTAQALSRFGVAGVGANCGSGPEQMLEVVQGLRRGTQLPVFAQPNAGIARLDQGRVKYDLTPEEMARWALQFVDQGAQLVGACCGSTPAHIAAIRQAINERIFKRD